VGLRLNVCYLLAVSTYSIFHLQINAVTLERKSGTLGCVRFTGCHTFDKIAEKLDDLRREFSICERKIVATVTDNGSNFVKAFKEYGIKVLEEKECTEEEGDAEYPIDDDEENNSDDLVFFNAYIESDCEEEIVLPSHLRCCSHTISLVCCSSKISTKGVYSKLHNSTMSKCSSLWNLAGRPKSAEIIQEIMKCQLRLPCATRWNSLYDSLSLLVRHKDQLNLTMTQLGLPNFRDVEFEFLEEYVLVMQPLSAALDRLQSDKECYYGCMIPTLLAVEKKLHRLNTISLKHCQPLLNTVSSDFGKRFKNFLLLDGNWDAACKEAILASTSNPQFKLKFLTINNKFNTNTMNKKIQELLVTAMKSLDEHSTDTNVFEINDDGSNGSSDAFFDFECSSSSANPNQDSYEMEMLKYLGDGSNSLSSLHQYNRILKVFLRYNTPLSSSAPVERLFSLAGHILSPKRNRLSDKLFSQLVFLKGNETK